MSDGKGGGGGCFVAGTLVTMADEEAEGWQHGWLLAATGLLGLAALGLRGKRKKQADEEQLSDGVFTNWADGEEHWSEDDTDFLPQDRPFLRHRGREHDGLDHETGGHHQRSSFHGSSFHAVLDAQS